MVNYSLSDGIRMFKVKTVHDSRTIVWFLDLKQPFGVGHKECSFSFENGLCLASLEVQRQCANSLLFVRDRIPLLRDF